MANVFDQFDTGAAVADPPPPAPAPAANSFDQFDAPAPSSPPAPAAIPPPPALPNLADSPTLPASTDAPTPAPTPTANIFDKFDPPSQAAPPANPFDQFDPSPDKQNFIDQQRQDEQEPLSDKVMDFGTGVAKGLYGLLPMAWNVLKGGYGLATDPTMTPQQKLLAVGNTFIANMASMHDLAHNAATGLENIYARNFGSGVTDQEYGQQWDELQRQALVRRAVLNKGIQGIFMGGDTMLNNLDGLPAAAEENQENLSPLLDASNFIPFGEGAAAAGIGRTVFKAAGEGVAKQLVPSLARRTISGVLDRGADITDMGAGVMDSLRTAPQRGLQAMGVPEEAAKHMAGAPIHLLAGAAGGAEAIIPILAGEAAPGLLRQVSTLQRAASQAVLTGESTSSFVQRMIPATQGFTRTVLQALDQTGLAKVMGTMADVGATGIAGGVLNPFTPLQFLASQNADQFGQQVGSNMGFGVAGAGAHRLIDGGAAQTAARNYNDVVRFAARIAGTAGADDQMAAFNSLPFSAKVAVAQFANTRPDVEVQLKAGGANGENSSGINPLTNKPIVKLNVSNPAAAVAHIAAHEYTHTLMMIGDNRSRVLSALMGSAELGTDGPLGRWVAGMFVPSDTFKDFISRYTQRLGQDGAMVNAKNDTEFYNTMAEEFYAEDMAHLLSGTDKHGDTALSRVYRTGDTISKMVDGVLGRSGTGILDYLNRKYAQGRIAPRFGSDAISKSVAGTAHDKVLDGLRVLGLQALRRNESLSGRPVEYDGSTAHANPSFGINELKKNPAVAARMFGASHDVVFSPDGQVLGQRTRAQANAAARAQGRIWFATLSKMPPESLPPGAVRAVTRTDAKGKQITELQGKFLTDGQIDALIKANGLNRYQEGVLRQINRSLQAQDGNVHHVTYQTASDGKGKYATLASTTRDMVVRQIRVTKDHNIILDSFDVDQYLHNYDQMLQRAKATGRKLPSFPDVKQALRDYLANQALGYTGAGQALDPAHPPAQPPARIFSAHDAHTVNELFGVGTKDNAGVNPLFHEMDEAGVDRSRSTFKSFRLDRVNSIEATPDVLPVDYYRVKYNRSPNYRQEDEDALRSPHGQSIPPPDRVHGTGAPAAQVAPGPADRPQPAVPGDGRPGVRPQGDRRQPGGDARQAAQAAGPRDADRAPHPDARGRVPDAQDARLVAPYSPDAGRRVLYSPSSTDESSRPGDEAVRALARRYRAAVPGLGPEHSGYAPVDEALSRRVADAYQALRSDPTNPDVRRAYDAFINETLAQWNVAHAAGYRLEPWLKGGQPYASSREMLADLAQNRHLHYLPTVPEGGIGAFGEGEGVDLHHPLLREVGHWNGTPVVANDVFRAVHDVFGHAQGGFEFGPRGELNAYLEHRAMYSPLARRAMTAETMGQNSWVNYGAHMRRPDGTIPARGDRDYVPLQDRRYAEQKAALLPDTIHKEIETRYSPNQDELGDRYGAWIDRHGNVIPIEPRSSHEQTAIKHLRETGDITPDEEIEPHMEDVLFRRGYVRIVNTPDNIFSNGNHAVTPSQQRVLKRWGEDTGKTVTHDAEDANRVKYIHNPSGVAYSPNSLDGGGTVDGNDPENPHSAPQARAPGVGLAAGAVPGAGPQRGAGQDDDILSGARAVPPEHFFRSYLAKTGLGPGANDPDALLKHAAENKLIVRPSVIRALAPFKAQVDTREHHVYILPSKQVIKVVQPGKWGITGSDLDYFKNLRDMNLLTDGKLGIGVVGVTPAGTWPSVVTRMKYIEGVHPEQAYLTKYLEDRGFERRDVFGHIYDHLDSDVELWDAHTKNFIQTPDGACIPIDLHLRGDLRHPDAPRL